METGLAASLSGSVGGFSLFFSFFFFFHNTYGPHGCGGSTSPNPPRFVQRHIIASHMKRDYVTKHATLHNMEVGVGGGPHGDLISPLRGCSLDSASQTASRERSFIDFTDRGRRRTRLLDSCVAQKNVLSETWRTLVQRRDDSLTPTDGTRRELIFLTNEEGRGGEQRWTEGGGEEEEEEEAEKRKVRPALHTLTTSKSPL